MPACPMKVHPPNESGWVNVTGCENAIARNPIQNPEGHHDHWFHAPSDLDNENRSGELLNSEGVTGGVNCYPGVPGACYRECYIFVDYLSNPWLALERQLRNCPKTERIYIIGDWYSLKKNQLRGRKIKHFLRGASLFCPNLRSVVAREPRSYPSPMSVNLI
jgi:hypothetical protein